MTQFQQFYGFFVNFYNNGDLFSTGWDHDVIDNDTERFPTVMWTREIKTEVEKVGDVDLIDL